MKITYWSDYACPYCYIGETRLKKAMRELSVEEDIRIEMKAFQLDPDAPVSCEGDTLSRFAKKYGLSMEHAARSIEHISEMGREEGLVFNYASTLFTNTMDAHRLTKFAYDRYPDKADQLIETLYKAYFADNKELADKDLLLRIAEECGLDPIETRKVLDSEDYMNEVIADEKEAMYDGIHAVPFFVIGQYGISGAQSTENMKETILRVLKEEKKSTVKEGMTCGPEGCRIG